MFSESEKSKIMSDVVEFNNKLEDKVKYQLMSYISQFKAIKNSDIAVMIDLMSVIRDNQDLSVEEIYEKYIEILEGRL